MPTPYSDDLRAKVIQAIEGGMTKTKASRVFKLSRNTIDLWLKRREETGDYKAKVGYQKGYEPKIADLDKFREFARQNGKKTQAEMAQAWSGNISARTIGKNLKKIGFTRKKTYGYRERDEEKRQHFLHFLNKYEQKSLVYVDESGIDNRDDYGYGWNELGERFYDLKSGKRSIRVSIMSGLCQGLLVAPITFEGSCNRQVFEKWLEEMLLPSLHPGQIVILDNATFHKSQKITQLVREAGCQLQYLPPYSPDLNEIEHYWFPIKNRVRKTQGSIEDFRERVDKAVYLTS